MPREHPPPSSRWSLDQIHFLSPSSLLTLPRIPSWLYIILALPVVMAAGIFSIPALAERVGLRYRSRQQKRADLLKKRMGSTQFLGSQVGGSSVISYSYTDFPWKLFAWDIYYFFNYIWALPWIVWPISPADSGHLDELAFTRQNLFCIFIHIVLCVMQIAFILALPFAIFLPIWVAGLALTAFLAVNYLLCLLLNGPTLTYTSDPKYAPELPEHDHEKWIFLNGVAVGDHWMKNNLNRLALTFKRPILGIHNRTSGILFDVVECLIQRNLGYATYDVRMCYRIVKETLYNPKYSKVIFVLHSQGGIEGGLVLDWLLQELPQDLLGKLEVYTFGNAANHFNNPHRHVMSQTVAQKNPTAMTTTTTTTTMSHGDSISSNKAGLDDASTLSNGSETLKSHPGIPNLPNEGSSTSSRSSTAALDRAMGHVEHYAHSTDFVAIWGVLHFCTSLAASHTMPRFIGRLFVRASERGGHQFCQHYLDGMFPLAKDPETGEFTGASEENEFMESEIQIGRQGDAGANAREAFEVSYLGRDFASNVEFHGEQVKGRFRKRTVQVKELSRLWLYRNGGSPTETPPLLFKENGIVRNATL
ncbi:hypothetical protein CH63R_01205 [Colletotrichum higginsianum IMI 349063]|uniref:Uncharacterized protein n=2 Tax=Colletotrichum higginsianum (strain IMI 349063) TaxID=759273 RepID=A0A1B7YVE7_COLHI|nr:hypothetical protein CH63R_01205 [Colletotrichum higginsianum IMI 349063]OBR16025.1 hypothetical protein CH63R_01205 [Colletotrichum higginsianum IMI 349063]